MQVYLISNHQGGFADYVQIAEGTTVGSFFAERLGPMADPKSFLIRLNGGPVTPDHVLENDDRITITPTKIAGAAAVVVCDGYGSRGPHSVLAFALAA